MTFAEAKASGQRVRYHSWWWGRWVKYINDGKWISDDGTLFRDVNFLTPESKEGGWELYDDAKHGIHNDKKT